MDIKEERGFSIDYLNECFESAVDARKKAEVEHYGEFANER